MLFEYWRNQSVTQLFYNLFYNTNLASVKVFHTIFIKFTALINKQICLQTLTNYSAHLPYH